MYLFDNGLPFFCSNSIVTLSDGTIIYCENEVLELEEQRKTNTEVVLILSDQNGAEKSVCSSDISHIGYSD